MFPHRTEVIGLHFKSRSLRIDKGTPEIRWRDGRHLIEGQTDHDEHVTPLQGGKPLLHKAVIEDFIDAIHTGRKPLVTGEEVLSSGFGKFPEEAAGSSLWL